MVVQSSSYPHQKHGAISVLFTPKAGVNKHFLHFIHVVFRGALKRVLRRDSGGNWQVEEDQKEINTDVLHWLQCFTLLLFAESNKPFMNECRVGLSLASITQSIKTD